MKSYVAAVTAAAAAAAAATAVIVPGPADRSFAAVALVAAFVGMSELLVVRYYHHDEVHALNLMEGILGALVFIASGTQVVLATVVALALANAWRRNPLVKSLFNTSQWVLAASLGSLLFHHLRPASVHNAETIGVLTLVMLVMAAVNFVAISGVLALASGSPLGGGDGRKVRTVLVGHLIGNAASVVTGICLAGAYVWNAWALVVGLALVVGMHLAGRANASLHTDTARLGCLQRATHALATSMTATPALPVFLAEVRTGFEVEAVELVLAGDDSTHVHSVADDGYTTASHPHELLDLLAGTIAEPCRLAIGTHTQQVSDALQRTGHQRAIALPLISNGSLLGMLFLYDRVGMEGFEDGELRVASALGRELVSFFERVELVRAIDEQRRKLNDIVESTSDGILTIDADGAVTSWNTGFAAMTGYQPTEMIGTRHIGLLRARDASGRDVLLERWVDVVDSQGLPQELQVLTATGETVWLSCSYSRIPAAESSGDSLVVVARNVTQARELERLKDDFVAVVSHELRTPLVPIKGWAQTLLTRGERLNDDQRRTAVQSILAQAQRLESLLLNILEASRIEAGRTDRDGVADVVSIAARYVEDMLASRPDREIRFRPAKVPCNVTGSSVWVERAIANLVSNAVKYSPDDEPVDVVISTADSSVLVAVTDRGPGIAADAQERIFERFERLEESKTQTGTGLGLYITRRLARAMGGDVSVSSVPGAGSTFLLRLPLAPVTRLPEQRPTTDHNTVVHLG